MPNSGSANFGTFRTHDPSDRISKGLAEGESALIVTGLNIDLDAAREDLWPVGGILAYMPSADTLNYVSTSGSDTGTILVSGDLAGVIVSEQIVLNGTTPVPGGQLFDVINFMFLLSGDPTVGDITGTADTHATVQIGMTAEIGISQHGFHRVPLGYNAIIRQVEFNVAKLAGGQAPIVHFTLYARFSPTSPWVSILDRQVDAAVQNDIVLPFPVSNILAAGADIRMSALASEVNTQALMRVVGIQYKV